MKILSRTLILGCVLSLLALAACGKGEIKDDDAPGSGATSAPAADKPAEGGEKPAEGGEKPAEGAQAAGALDVAKYDALLKKYVTEGGVKYKEFKADAAAMADLKAFTDAVGTADISGLERDAKLAFYINAYNAHTLEEVLERYPIASVMDVKDPEFFKGIKHKVAGEEMTLDVLENQKIREGFKEARIHFVVNCASASCPRLRRDAITAANLEAELEAGATEYVRQETKVDAANKTVETSQIFEWFAGDFQASAGSVDAFLAKYVDPAQAEAVKGAKITFHPYGWTLNEAK